MVMPVQGTLARAGSPVVSGGGSDGGTAFGSVLRDVGAEATDTGTGPLSANTAQSDDLARQDQTAGEAAVSPAADPLTAVGVPATATTLSSTPGPNVTDIGGTGFLPASPELGNVPAPAIPAEPNLETAHAPIATAQPAGAGITGDTTIAAPGFAPGDASDTAVSVSSPVALVVPAAHPTTLARPPAPNPVQEAAPTALSAAPAAPTPVIAQAPSPLPAAEPAATPRVEDSALSGGANGHVASPPAAESSQSKPSPSPANPSVDEPLNAKPGTAPAVPLATPLTPSTPAPAPVALSPQSPPMTHQAQPLTTQLAQPLFSLAASGPGEHRMTLQITPENLGPVTVRAVISGDDIRIEMFSPTESGRDALRQILSDLRRDLASGGLSASLDLSPKERFDERAERQPRETPTGPSTGNTDNRPDDRERRPVTSGSLSSMLDITL